MQWTHLSRPWQAAFEQAWEAWCAGTLPIGCAITDGNENVLFTGRNRIFESEADRGLLAGNQLAHAEMNALAPFPMEEVDPGTCVLYSTLEPCPMCTGAIYMMGIGAVQYAARDPLDGSVTLLESTPPLSNASVRVTAPSSPELELVSTTLIIASVLVIGDTPKVPPEFIRAFQRHAPDAAQIAQRLHETSELRQLCDQGAHASEAYNLIRNERDTTDVT